MPLEYHNLLMAFTITKKPVRISTLHIPKGICKCKLVKCVIASRLDYSSVFWALIQARQP